MPKYKMDRWNLKRLVHDSGRRSLQNQIGEVEKLATRFEKRKASLNSNISNKQFQKILTDMEEIIHKMSIIGGYASLSYSADTQSDKTTSLVTKASRLDSEIENQIIFFDLWWKNKVDEKNARRLRQGMGELTEYLRHKRFVAKYSLAESEEKLINTLDVTGITALVKLYDKITNSFVYKMKLGRRIKSMTREELTNHIRSTNHRTRETAYKTILTKYEDNKGVIGEIYQNIVLNWRDRGMKIRGYESPISMRNTGNNVDDKTVESLLATCKKNRHIFQKFFVQKAKMLGMKKLRRYDLYAPIVAKGKVRYTYDKAVRLVLESLGKFDHEFEDFAKRVFTEDHIDSEIRHGKMDGAFCSTVSPKITPYVLINFTGKTKDVFTLAHELGHAVHSQAAENRSILVQHASLPLAETASTFSELLLYDSISSKMTNEERKVILAEKIDDLYATILRQSFFTMFEADAHKQIADGTTIEEISELYMQNLTEQFGRSVTLTRDFAIEWSYIPHFYHTPFYCYAYSFGCLLALSLFQRYKKEGRDFVPAYMEILSAGGSKKPEDLLAEHGFDIRTHKFWQEGFRYTRMQTEELARLG